MLSDVDNLKLVRLTPVATLGTTSALSLQSVHYCRVANLAFLKPDFEILAFFEHLSFGFVGRSKKARQNLAFFQSERLGSGKTLPKLHIQYKSLLKVKRV